MSKITIDKNIGGGGRLSYSKEEFDKLPPKERQNVASQLISQNPNTLPGWAQLEVRRSQGLDVGTDQASNARIAELEAQQAEAKKLQSMGVNPDGSPIRPGWDSQLGPDGLLKDNYRLTDRGLVQVDQRGIGAIRERALSQGPSAWAKMMTDKQKLEEQGARDQAAQSAQGQNAQAYNDLSMRGGVSGGARNRIAMMNSRNSMMAGQNVARQGMLDRANIGVQDETQRLGLLNNLAGLDFQQAGLDERNRAYSTDIQGRNINAALSELDKKRMQDMNVYSEQMKKWAAGKSADAQAAAGSGGKK